MAGLTNRIPDTIRFEGQEVNLWTWGQLDRLNKDKLRARALTLRDVVGADRVPKPPHHEEGLRVWILETQCAMTGLGMEDFGMKQVNSQGMPLSRAASEAVAGDVGDDMMMGGQAGAAYADARRASLASRDRNRGSENILAPSMADSDRGAAYMDARRTSQAARDRNRGSSNLLSWA